MNRCGFRLYDKKYYFKSAKDAYLNALRVMKNKRPDLYVILGRVANTNDRGFFVRSPDEVYKKSPALAEISGTIERLEAGWYTATNISNREKETMLNYACGIMSVKYLDEFEIWFDGGNNKYTPLSKEEANRQLDSLLSQLDSHAMAD